MTLDPLHEDTVRGQVLLEEHRSAVEPYDRQAVEANRGAIAFAVMGLRALFVLNGGALIVFPAYLSLLDINVDVAFEDSFTAAASFIAGLLAVALATLIGYLTQLQSGRHAYHGKQAVVIALQNALRGPGLSAATDAIVENHKIAAAKAKRMAAAFRALAVVFALLSLGCFTSGAYFAAAAVITGTEDDSDTGPTRI